jgi:hypothetical protein
LEKDRIVWSRSVQLLSGESTFSIQELLLAPAPSNEDPFALTGLFRFSSDNSKRFITIGDAIDAGFEPPAGRTAHIVQMIIDQARNDSPPLEVDPLRVRPGHSTDRR